MKNVVLGLIVTAFSCQLMAATAQEKAPSETVALIQVEPLLAIEFEQKAIQERFKTETLVSVAESIKQTAHALKGVSSITVVERAPQVAKDNASQPQSTNSAL